MPVSQLSLPANVEAVLQGKIVVTSAYLAQAYASFVLNRDYASLLKNIIEAMKEAGLSDYISEIEDILKLVETVQSMKAV